MSSALDRAQRAYDNMVPEDDSAECPECGCPLEYNGGTWPTCPAQKAWQDHFDEPDEYPEPKDDPLCEWVYEEDEDEGPDGDHQMEYERENRED